MRSIMFSNIADSSKAGFIVADSTNSSARVEISANFRNHWIFSLISVFERSMVSFVSISYAQRFSEPSTRLGRPKTSWPRRLDREWTGFVEQSIVRLPLAASQSARAPAIAVFPTPPFPPKNTYFTGLRVRNAAIDSAMSGAVASRTFPGSVAIHHARQPIDHCEPRHVAFHLRDFCQHLRPEPGANAVEIPLLHADAVAQIRGDFPTQEMLRHHAIHDVACDGHVELREQLGRLPRVQDGHLFGNDHEEESRLLAVSKDLGRGADATFDVLQLAEDLVLLEHLLPLHDRSHLLVLAHLLPKLGDLADPLVVDLRHRQIVEGVAEGDEIVDVVVVLAGDHDVDDGVEDRALLHRRLRGRRLDVLFDLLGDGIEAVHVEDLLSDLVLVLADATVGVDLLGPKVGHDGHRALSEEVLMEDFLEARLRIDREDQDSLALFGEPVARRSGEGRLPESALPTEHDVPAIRVPLERVSQASHLPLFSHRLGRPVDRSELAAQMSTTADAGYDRASVMSFSRSIRRFQVATCGTT